MSFEKAHQYIQKNVLNYARTDYVGGTLQAVLAAARTNTTITATDFGTEDGKLRELKINYLPPACSDTGSCSDNICNPGIEPAPQQVYFKLQQCTASQVLTISQSNLRHLDQIGANDYALGLLRQRLSTVRKKLATQVTAILVANRGVLPNGASSKLVQLIDPNTGRLRPDGIWEVERNYVDAELSTPYVVGGGPVYNIQKNKTIGTGNDDGQDIGRVQNPNWYYDKDINGALGNSTENLITFDAQLIKFIGFNFNAGRFATDLKGLALQQMFQSGPDWLSSTILDPDTGLLWDLEIVYDKCTKKWSFQWKLNWDLFTLPLPVCGVQGLNGIMHFTTCPPAEITCPAPDPNNGPQQPATYQYDPAFTYPLFVEDFIINGNSFKPQRVVASDAELLQVFNEFGGGGFSLNADIIEYSGYSALSGKINELTYSFAEAPQVP